VIFYSYDIEPGLRARSEIPTSDRHTPFVRPASRVRHPTVTEIHLTETVRPTLCAHHMRANLRVKRSLQHTNARLTLHDIAPTLDTVAPLSAQFFHDTDVAACLVNKERIVSEPAQFVLLPGSVSSETHRSRRNHGAVDASGNLTMRWSIT